jgi:hypothetical protein
MAGDGSHGRFTVYIVPVHATEKANLMRESVHFQRHRFNELPFELLGRSIQDGLTDLTLVVAKFRRGGQVVDANTRGRAKPIICIVQAGVIDALGR